MNAGVLLRLRKLQYQNPLSNLGIKTKISRLWSIPDHQQGNAALGYTQGREPVEGQMMP